MSAILSYGDNRDNLVDFCFPRYDFTIKPVQIATDGTIQY